MQGQLVLQNKLTQALEEIRQRNPAYSMRRFAQKIGLHPAALSEILNGKRRVSRKVAEAIGQKLCLSPEEMQEILKWYQGTRLVQDGAKTDYVGKNYVQLNMDQFRLIADWYHFGILSLVETEGFKSDPAWIADRLGIRETDAQGAIDRLERLEMLVRDRRGTLRRNGSDYTTTDGIANSSLRRGYARDLEMAQESLDRDDVSIRDFASVTMAIDPEKLPVAKKMIREFRDHLCVFLETGKKREVYKFNSQLIPLSRKGRSK